MTISFLLQAVIGRNKTFYIGMVRSQNLQGNNPGSEVIQSTLTMPVIIGMSVGGGIMLVFILVIYVAYRRKSQESDLVMKRMQNQMDVLEARVAKECKEGQSKKVFQSARVCSIPFDGQLKIIF